MVTVNQHAEITLRESLRQPAWHVIALSVLTCCSYLFYWFYKTWRDLQAYAHDRATDPGSPLSHFAGISPPLRTLGLLLPLVNFLFGIILPRLLVLTMGVMFSILALYFCVTLIYGIARLHPNAASFARRRAPLATGLIVLGLVGFTSLAKLADPFWLLSFGCCVPLAIVQSWLNAYWRSVEDTELAVRQAFTIKEILAIIVGSLLLGLVLANLLGVAR
ncbi:MAG TPA: DUF4234 domain-containing protein [Candidatus Obscuribacterales bacterium]